MHDITSTDSLFWLEADGKPWHGLGASFDRPPATWQEAHRWAGLDWRVETRPKYVPVTAPGQSLYRPDPENENRRLLPEGLRGPGQASPARPLPAEQSFIPSEELSIVRLDTQQEIGSCRPGFTLVQNAEAFQFLDQLGDQVEYRVAGSLRGGRVIWILVTLPDFLLEIGPSDPMIPYLLLSNSHDGSQAFQVQLSTIRVVCANTLQAAHLEAAHHDIPEEHIVGLAEGEVLPTQERLRSGRVLVKLYHSARVHQKMQLADEFLESARRDFEATQEVFRELAQHRVTDEELSWFLRELEPDPDPGKNPARRQANRERLLDYYQHGPGADLPSAQGTLWGLVNAAAFYVDHRRGRLTEWTRERQDRALHSSWFGSGRTYKTDALKAAGQILVGQAV